MADQWKCLDADGYVMAKGTYAEMCAYAADLSEIRTTTMMVACPYTGERTYFANGVKMGSMTGELR